MIEQQLRIIIKHIQEKKRGRKQKVHIDQLEEYVMRSFAEPKLYREYGGYRVFHDAVVRLKSEGTLVPLARTISNGRSPTLEAWMWVNPLSVQDYWNLEQIARVTDHLDLDYYLKHKEEQTDIEWRKLEIIHRFLTESYQLPFVSREQRSLLLFSGESWLGEVEAEKWLNHQEGKALMKKLKLTPEKMRYYEVREPFVYWKNNNLENDHVLILENLSVYHTCKEILKRGERWFLGPVPSIVIWGAGNRIESTIDYIEEVVNDPSKAKIHYAGDLDYSGISIYIRLKEKNKHLHITAAQPFYRFMIQRGKEYVEHIQKEQRRVDSHLKKFLSEFSDLAFIANMNQLWIRRKRIAQEVVNDQLIMGSKDNYVI